jgi:hypothetical protein
MPGAGERRGDRAPDPAIAAGHERPLRIHPRHLSVATHPVAENYLKLKRFARPTANRQAPQGDGGKLTAKGTGDYIAGVSGVCALRGRFGRVRARTRSKAQKAKGPEHGRVGKVLKLFRTMRHGAE